MNCTELRNELNPGWNEPGPARQWVPPSWRPIGSTVETVQLWLFLCIYILSLFAFFLAKQYSLHYPGPYSDFLDVRPMFAIIITHGGAVIELFRGDYFNAAPTIDSTPCVVTMFFTIPIVPMLALPLFVRAVAFYRRAAISNVTVAMKDMTSSGFLNSSSKHLSSVDGDDIQVSQHLEFWQVVKALLFAFSPQLLLLKGKVSPTSSSPGNSGSSTNLTSNNDKLLESNIRIWQYLSSKRAGFITCLFYLSPCILASIVITATNPMVLQGCYGCLFNSTQDLVLYLFAALAIGMIILAMWLIRKLPESFGVRREIFIAAICGGSVAIVAMIIRGFTDADQEWNWNILTTIALLFQCQMQSSVQLFIVWRQTRSLTRLEAQRQQKLLHERNSFVSSKTRIEFESVLTDGPLHDAFERHLTNEHGVESLRFIDEVSKWQRMYNDVPRRTSYVRARNIVHLFIGESALFPINIPGEIILNLLTQSGVHDEEKKLNDTKADLPLDFFQKAVDEIKILLSRDGFMRFLHSKEYLETLDKVDATMLVAGTIN